VETAEARLDELMTEVQQTGAELKSLAPLLVDFPPISTARQYSCVGWKANRSWPGTTARISRFAGRRGLP
jgi:hypothetical protein